MITLSGILAHCGDDTTNYIFTKSNIEWVGGDDINARMVDGKSMDWIENNLDNEDICAIIVDKSIINETTGEISKIPTVYYNPGRVFKRIIHKYNGDLVGTTKMETGSYSFSGVADYGDDKQKLVQSIVWNYFRGNGFTEQATAAIMGNIQQESGFNPGRLQSGGPAAGLFQWENYNTQSGRWLALKGYADLKGKDWTDPGVQCEFAYNEMGGLTQLVDIFKTYSGKGGNGTYSNGTPWGWPEKISLSVFKSQTDISIAVQMFEQCFERASIPRMEKRIQYATEFYNEFSGSNITVSGSSYTYVTQNNWRYWRNW